MRFPVWQFRQKAGLHQRSHYLHLGRMMTKANWAANQWQIQGTNSYEEKRDTDGGFTGIRHHLLFFLWAFWDGLMTNNNFVFFSLSLPWNTSGAYQSSRNYNRPDVGKIVHFHCQIGDTTHLCLCRNVMPCRNAEPVNTHHDLMCRSVDKAVKVETQSDFPT